MAVNRTTVGNWLAAAGPVSYADPASPIGAVVCVVRWRVVRQQVGVTRLAALQVDDPRRVGPYVLLGRLGSGGMGRVYLARSPGGRQVAVKVIRAELADDDGFRARFAREVAAARKVGGLFT